MSTTQTSPTSEQISKDLLTIADSYENEDKPDIGDVTHVPDGSVSRVYKYTKVKGKKDGSWIYTKQIEMGNDDSDSDSNKSETENVEEPVQSTKKSTKKESDASNEQEVETVEEVDEVEAVDEVEEPVETTPKKAPKKAKKAKKAKECVIESENSDNSDNSDPSGSCGILTPMFIQFQKNVMSKLPGLPSETIEMIKADFDLFGEMLKTINLMTSGTASAPVKKSKKSATGKVYKPRQPSAYNLFVSGKMSELKTSNPELETGGDRMAAASRMWAALTDEEKAAFAENNGR